MLLTASVLRIYVTWQGTNVELPDDDRNVETCSSIYYIDTVVIYTVAILIVRLLVVMNTIKLHSTCIKIIRVSCILPFWIVSYHESLL